ncbi:MAG TPA: FkbM family methyltransferase, partial [Smithellaceae bacterium]|nr:FkbM family methyltransferase [Smithellaceae bacterium]
VQYFESGIISVVPQEVFVDCGAYSGDTILEFKKQAKDGFKKIFAFEPDRKNMRNLKQMIEAKEQDRIMPVSAGVYCTSRTIRFMAEGTLDSRISGAQGADAVEVFSLDDYFRDKETPTFIKMDIEGAEEEALLGASGIIQRCAPKLAISVYHRAADLWRLPLLMKKLNKNYRLYLRHYSREIVDTVCYGV